MVQSAKLLIDPYAKAVTGDIRWGPEVYSFCQEIHDLPDPVDNAPFVPKGVVIDPTFRLGRRLTSRYSFSPYGHL